MKTVREVSYEILRAHGLTTLFGNPGSNELPFLKGFPSDFRYILALHEGVAVGMADGYAQATGRPPVVSLHAAAGTGNGMGALANAFAAHTPMILLAGQQIREMVGLNVMLTNVDATALPRPLVKSSVEPATPGDVPRALSEAILYASAAPAGPVFLSVPWDDWDRPADPAAIAHLAARQVQGGAGPSPAALAELTERLARARNPVLIYGPDVDISGAFDAGVELADKLRAPVWAAPSIPRCPFPTDHPAFRGILPAAIGGISRLLAGHDLALVIGAAVFRYHHWVPGPLLPDGCELIAVTSDPHEAARAPMGDAIVADVRATLEALAEAVPQRDRPSPAPRAVPAPPPAEPGVLSGAEIMQALNDVAPDDVIYVNETTSTVADVWNHLRISRPKSHYFPAGGGLGFGLPAALGVQLAEPERRVIGIIGDGAANYAIPALWTAAHYRIPAIILVLNNGTYGALRRFAREMQAEDAPGLDLPGVDYVKIAEGYGVKARRVDTPAALRDAVSAALTGREPVLIEIPIPTG